MLSEIVLFFVVFFALHFIARKGLVRKSRNNLPPGPWGYPILGHLPLLGSRPHEKLLEWKKDYGPMMTLQFGSFPTLVLNDGKLIKEAFSLAAFSGRGQLKVFSDAAGGKGISWNDGARAVEQRNFIKKTVKDFSFGKTEEIIHEEVEALVDLINEKVEGSSKIPIKGLFSPSSVNTFWRIAIGERFQLKDPFIHHLAHMVGENLARSDTVMSKLALFLPWLNDVMPGVCNYNVKMNTIVEAYDFVDKRIKERKKTWVKGQPRDLTDAYFDKTEETTDPASSFHASRNEQHITTFDVFGAAVETTATTLEWGVNLLARHPEVQSRLQREIEQVVGSGRLPYLSDRPSMPYTDAVILELNRYASIIPLGVFRRTLEDVEFHGYTIPKNTMVIGHAYGIHHDQDVWGDPENFRPERFLKMEGRDGPYVKNENTPILLPFSYGKRDCIGSSLARDQLFLFLTGLFQSFNMALPGGAGELKSFFGLTLQPHPFDLEVTLRK